MYFISVFVVNFNFSINDNLMHSQLFSFHIHFIHVYMHSPNARNATLENKREHNMAFRIKEMMHSVLLSFCVLCLSIAKQEAKFYAYFCLVAALNFV